MSELTSCNHCTLKDMERRAAKRGATVKVTQLGHNTDMPGWYAAQCSDENKPSAYFVVLTVDCAC